MTKALPSVLPGHWATPGGQEMATGYLSIERRNLCMGDRSDMALANEVYMADRGDLNLIGYQTAAKERIRWLSAQLAAARMALEDIAATDGEECRAIANRALDACR